MFTTHLQHPGCHYPSHVGRYFFLDTFEIVGSGEILVLCPQELTQDPVSHQVGVPVGPGRPRHLTAKQLRFHLRPCGTVSPPALSVVSLWPQAVRALSLQAAADYWPLHILWTFLLFIGEKHIKPPAEIVARLWWMKSVRACLAAIAVLLYSCPVELQLSLFCWTGTHGTDNAALWAGRVYPHPPPVAGAAFITRARRQARGSVKWRNIRLWVSK